MGVKVSIITAMRNNRETAEACIKSVLSQSYGNIEYIVIDGDSTDGTSEIVSAYRDKIAKVVSEKDKGLYYALNKGIKLATGEVVGFLNGDDIFSDENVIAEIAKVFNAHEVDSVYGDLLYVSRNNTGKVIRQWDGGTYDRRNLAKGWMAPHPTFYVKRDIYEKYGIFNTDFKIAADYEIILRFLYKQKISTYYIPKVLVKMRVGGLSNKSIENVIRKSAEDYKICKLYGLGFGTLFMKNISKIPQLILHG
jgi:glycosyltransferase